MARYKIGQAAALVGTTPRTLKWYEELDLLPCTERTPGGFRLYDDQDIETIRRIQRMQGLGLSLQTIRSVLQHQAIVDDTGRTRLPMASMIELQQQLQAERADVACRVERLRTDLAAGEQLLADLDHDLSILTPRLEALKAEESTNPRLITGDKH